MSDNAFRALRANGYANVLPIIPPGAEVHENSSVARTVGKPNDSRGKSPGVKRGGKWTGLPDWQTRVATDEDADAWHAMGASVGLRMGDGVICVDIDALQPKIADQIEADAIAAFGPSPQRVGQWPKRALFYRIDEDTPYQTVEFATDNPDKNDKIEFACAGRQMALLGTHPKTGKPYLWPRPLVAKADLGLITAAQLADFIAQQRAKLPAATHTTHKSGAERAVNQDGLRGDPALVAEAMRALPNNRELFKDRDDYIRVGAAVKGALPDDAGLAFDLWTEWAEKDNGGTPDVWDKDWRGIKPPFAVGAGWLFDQAAQHAGFNTARVHFDELPDEIESPFAQAEAKEAQAAAAAARRTLPTITLQEASDTALSSNAKPLVHGLLDQETLNMLYGASNTGKTFVAMDMAFCIAHGLEWAGQRTEQTGVLYVAAEGGHGIKKRARALTMHRYAGVPVSSAFNLIPSPIDLYDPKGDLEPLLQTIAALARSGQKVGLVVLDTLSRVLPGGKEDTQDMGVFVARATTIKTLMGCAVLVIHHSGKNEAQGARGSSVLRAAVDTEMEVKDGRVSITKQRDHEPLPDLQFTLSGVVVGRDDLGAEVSSAVVHFGQSGAAVEQAPTEMEAVILEALASYAGEHPNSKGAPPSGIKDVLSRDGADISVEGVRAHLKRLARKGLVALSGRGVWVEKVRKVQLSGSQNRADPTEAFEDLDAQTGQPTGQGIFC